MQRAVGLIVILLVFAVLNGLLYGVQEVHSRYRVRAADDFKREMDFRWREFLRTKGAIEQMERQLESNKTRLNQLGSEITAIEIKYGESGAPPDVHAHHNSLVAEYNGLVRENRSLVTSHDRAITEFNSQVDAYNRDLDRYNSLIAKIPQSYWLIIPMPGRSSRKAPKPVPVGPLKPAPVRP